MTQTRHLHSDNVTSPDAVPTSVPSPHRRRWSAAPRDSVRPVLADRHRTFLVLIGATVAAVLLTALPSAILNDTWLALVDGRWIAQHGIPHHVVLTVFGYGHPWHDQQWLAQLLMYGLQQLGGLPLLGVVTVALVLTGLAGAAAAAIRLGASPRAVLPVFLVVAMIDIVATEVRTQSFAYPLFVLVVYLLAADSRRSTRRVFWCLPVLVLWANLHGSVTLGAGLVALRGLTMLWERRHELATGGRRPLALIVGAPVALMITPYGTGIVSYYRVTLLSPAFRAFVAEWQPVTESTQLAIVFFLLAGVSLWALGRYTARTTPWERAAMLLLAVGGILAVRNVVWFALATLIILPGWIDGAVRARERSAPPRPRLNAALLLVAGLLVALFLVGSLRAGAARLTPKYPAQALAAARRAVQSQPGTRVFADETYADWLLWKMPGLSGRMAYDVAFELLSRQEFAKIADFKSVSGLDWERAVKGYGVLVLSSARFPTLVPALRARDGAHVLYDQRGVAVLER